MPLGGGESGSLKIPKSYMPSSSIRDPTWYPKWRSRFVSPLKSSLIKSPKGSQPEEPGSFLKNMNHMSQFASKKPFLSRFPTKMKTYLAILRFRDLFGIFKWSFQWLVSRDKQKTFGDDLSGHDALLESPCFMIFKNPKKKKTCNERKTPGNSAGALFEMVKWPFGKVKWPPTEESKGHFESLWITWQTWFSHLC